MNKKFFQLLFLLILPWAAEAQISFQWQGGSNYVAINNYSGTTVQNEAMLKIMYDNISSTSNWKITAKITSATASREGKYFPVNELSLSPASTDGSSIPSGTPSLSQIGVPASVPFQATGQEIYLVPQSGYALSNTTATPYYLQLNFNLSVAGGAYLGNFAAWSQFSFYMVYTLYDGNNNILGQIGPEKFDLQINPLSGTPPAENQYSISISTAASGGLLELNTMSDYVNGKSVTYTDGLSVSSNTDYQVTVRSVDSEFQSASGNTLPLGVVSLGLANSRGNANASLTSVQLSTSAQTVLQGASTSNTLNYYDIGYSTTSGDSRLYNATSDNYSTSLIYEISPR